MSTTGTDAPPPLPGGWGVPVVDLTAALGDLLIEAERMRLSAAALEQVAAVQRRQAHYLEALAVTLGGHG